jgi:hypothetical protein
VTLFALEVASFPFWREYKRPKHSFLRRSSPAQIQCLQYRRFADLQTAFRLQDFWNIICKLADAKLVLQTVTPLGIEQQFVIETTNDIRPVSIALETK